MTNAESPQQTATLTLGQGLKQAIAHHQAGQLQDAERLYRAILQARPNHPDANHNLNLIKGARVKGARVELNPASPLPPTHRGYTNSKPRPPQGGGVFLYPFFPLA